MRLDPKDRFLSKIRVCESGCHEWTSTIKKDGYGSFWLEKPTQAHIAAWKLFKGSVGGLFVLHKCDNRKCVNLDHLYLGTQRDNVRDMHARGRFVGHRTLSPADVADIRALLDDGRSTQSELAHLYGVRQSAISKIRTNRTWVNQKGF
jgi:hypothetical protein